MPRREKILVELARIIERYGVDEVLALARAMRDDPATVNDLAGLLERVAEAVHQSPRKSRTRARKKVANPRRSAVRSALQEGYTTLESLGGILDRLKIDRDTIATVEDAQRAILGRLDSVADPNHIEIDIIEGATRPGGELGRLTEAIVSKRSDNS
jgi:hypothetical protein